MAEQFARVAGQFLSTNKEFFMKITTTDLSTVLLFQHIGSAIHEWNFVVGVIEFCIIRFMGIKHPVPKGMSSFLNYVSDRQKIDILLTLYHDNPEYHHLISYNDISKKLYTGLESRNYFAHKMLFIGKKGKIGEIMNLNKKDPQPKLDAIEWEKLAQHQQNIQDAMDFLMNFWDEAERIKKT